MTTQELVERLLRVHYATLDWAEDFRRIGNADGETSEKARAELLKAAASRLSEMEAENKRLRDALRLIANRPTNIPIDPHGMAQFARAALEHQQKGEKL